ncbi:hypothetical protein [Francisella sp. 19X1-34]|uniref:hypothetical protein n=1 Tax=Francisella sp. 19X1-34 TaxID=3087177 RepID=UPI002E362D56|nr:hypothetical protein [Francisella sp. 19X1-34]MED7788569.1 hypothetical protein [Francisella sp. 19X1-34]
MSEKDNSNKTTKERSKLLAPEKRGNKKSKFLISEGKTKNKASNNKKLLIDETDNEISNENEFLVSEDQSDDNETNELLTPKDQNTDKSFDENDKLIESQNQNDNKKSDTNSELLKSENEIDNETLNESDEFSESKDEFDSETPNKDSELLISDDENDSGTLDESDETSPPKDEFDSETLNQNSELLISDNEIDSETLNESDETSPPKDEFDSKNPNKDSELLISDDENDSETLNESDKPSTSKDESDSETPNQDNEILISDDQNDHEPLVYNEESSIELTEPATSKKKKIIRVLIGVVIVGVCAAGVNKYIDYRHEVFLQEYAKAIINIKSKNVKGYKAAFEILQDLADDDEAIPSDYYYLGYLYQYGFGTQKNYSNAYKYYKKANTSQAFYQLAILYKYGQGVNKNNDKALEYFKKSYKLGNKKALVGLANFLEANPRLISTTDPEILYQIYLAYNSSEIKENKSGEKDKYLSIAVSKGYEPATIKQAQIFAKNKDYHRASILWQTLLYSSNIKTADLAEKEMAKIEDLIKQQREKELEQETSKKEIVEKKPQPKIKPKLKNEKVTQQQIEANRRIGLTIPKQNLKNLNGLVYINLLNTDKEKLHNFYKSISGIEIENDWIINSKNSNSSYINNLIDLDQLKHNKSSLKFDFGNTSSTNKYEGLVYYFYNNDNELIQNIINNIIQNKPKESSLIPNLTNDNLSIDESSNKNVNNKAKIQQEQGNVLEKLKERKTVNTQKQTQQKNQDKKKGNQIQLTYKEKIQRMQVFAQKGDYKDLYKLEHAANDGDVYAIYYMGVYYYNLKDYKKAMEYFKKAAGKNYGPADYMLGNMYYDEKENGISYNKEKAVMYYKRAANLGVANAEHILMLMS